MQTYKTLFSAILIVLFSLPAMEKTVEAGDIWIDDFTGGTPGEQPGGWRDETNNPSLNAEIAFSDIDSYAAITRTAEGTEGKVGSPLQDRDVDSYPLVEIKVDQISSETTWLIGIQGFTPSKYWPLNSWTSETGTFAFNYKDETGWAGNQDFRIVIQVTGVEGKFIEIDFVRICDDAVVPTCTHTATSTVTPTITPSSTQTPDWSSTMTPTPTMTPTATPTRTQDISTQTFTPTATPTRTPDKNTRTHTPTATPTRTPDKNTRTHTPTATPTRTQDKNTRTHTPTATPTSTEVVGTPTNTPIVTPMPTNTPMATVTPEAFDENLEFTRLNRKTFTPQGSVDRELEIYFRSKLSSREIKVSIFDINGRRQAILEVVGNSPDYQANWSGGNESGRALPAGIYIYEIKAGDSAYRGVVVLAR